MMLNQSVNSGLFKNRPREHSKTPSQLPQQLEWLNCPFYVWAKCDWSRESEFVNTQDLACSLPFFTGTQRGLCATPSSPVREGWWKGLLTSFCFEWVESYFGQGPLLLLAGVLLRARRLPCSGSGVPEWGTNPVHQARTLSGRNPGHFFTVH